LFGSSGIKFSNSPLNHEKTRKRGVKRTPKMQDLQSEEMKHFQGGMNMTLDSDLGTYVLDEVTVYGDAPGPGPQSECPQCQG
jgi:hypothetical protein